MNVLSEKIIISAEKSENRPERNKQLTENLRGNLSDCGIEFADATGLFNGVEESSLIVKPKNEEEALLVRTMAFKSFNQDSILYINQSNEAFLELANSTGRTYQGVIVEVDKNELLNKDVNYTLVNGVYYTTKFRKVTTR